MSYDSILSSSSGLLIIITGIMVSGKTTIARELGKKYSYRVISVDDFKVDLCDKYGFVSEYESKILSDSAEGLFRAEVIRGHFWMTYYRGLQTYRRTSENKKQLTAGRASGL